jgi:hypothetical protein
MAQFNERKFELLDFQGKVLSVVWAASVADAQKKARQQKPGTVNAVRETHFVRRKAKDFEPCPTS